MGPLEIVTNRFVFVSSLKKETKDQVIQMATKIVENGNRISKNSCSRFYMENSSWLFKQIDPIPVGKKTAKLAAFQQKPTLLGYT